MKCERLFLIVLFYSKRIPMIFNTKLNAKLTKIICALCFFVSSLLSEETFSKEIIDKVKNSHALVAISAYYDPSRLQYLSKVLASLATIPKVDIIVLTNTFKENELLNIKNICDQATQSNSEVTISIRSYDLGINGYFLTWCHKPIISDEFIGSKYSHFIYLEDDMEFKLDNFCYFIQYRERFRMLGLLPSFLRVEYHSGFNDFTNTDNCGPVTIMERPNIELDDLYFVELPNPYTACFVLDQELAAEYIQTPSFDYMRSFLSSQWNIRERAAMGLCFEHIPKGFTSRYVVAVSKKIKAAPRYTWVAHLPNTYANKPNCAYGKQRMSTLFIFPKYQKKQKASVVN